MAARQVDVRRELDRLRDEVERLRASRRRLVLAADAGRRAIERELHDHVHQHLVALAVELQLAEQAADTDPVATKTSLDAMRRDVQHALDKTARLAQRTYPAMLEARSLGALLRAAAVDASVPASVDVVVGSTYAPEVGMTIYLCWLDVLACASGEAHVAITVRERGDELTFELIGNTARSESDLERALDRVEALGGRLTIGTVREGAARLSGSLPLAR